MPRNVFTQKELFDYLKANPLGVSVHIGELEDMNGKDYIFVDFLSDSLIGADDSGVYKTSLQITVCTKNFDDRFTLTKYVQEFMNVQTNYDKTYDYEYWTSRSKGECILCAGK